MFPNITGFISKDPKTPFLHYAVVLNGKLQATNGKMAYYTSVDTFLSKEEAKIVEGKIFNLEDLKNIHNSMGGSRAKNDMYRASFHKNYYAWWPDTQAGQPVEYVGIIDSERRIHLYDDLLEDYVLAKDFKKFPDFTTVFPALDGVDIDPAQVQKRNTHFRGVGVPTSMLSVIAESFQSDNLRLEFFHAAKDRDKVDKVSAAILVTPMKTKHPIYKEAAIVNPVILSTDGGA